MVLEVSISLVISFCVSCAAQGRLETRQGNTNISVNVVANTSIPSDWKRVRLCGLSISLPPSLKEKKLQPIDSCIGNFEDRDIRVTLDSIPVGIEEKVFTRRNEYSNNREFKVVQRSVGGFKAEIVTCLAATDAKLQYVTVLDVPEPGLTVWVYSANAENQKIADQIVSSVQFDR